MSNAPHDSSRQEHNAEPREESVNNIGGTRSIIGSTRGKLGNWQIRGAVELGPHADTQGLTHEERELVREKLGKNLAVARVVLVRHGDTGAKTAFEVKTASTNILPEEERRAAEKTAPSLLALGLDPKNTLLEFSGSATRARQTADALNKVLNIPSENVCDWEVGGATTDKTIPNPHKAQAQQAVRAMDYAPALGWALREYANTGFPRDAVVIAHQSTWAGFRSGAHNVKNTVFANDPEGFTPLETREFDVAMEQAGPLEYLNHDTLGFVHVTAKCIKDIITALDGRGILKDACARMQARLLRVTDFQNLVNATLIADPVLSKSLAGCGVPELELMALRAAMGVGVFHECTVDIECATASLTAILSPKENGRPIRMRSASDRKLDLRPLARTLELSEKKDAFGRLATKLGTKLAAMRGDVNAPYLEILEKAEDDETLRTFASFSRLTLSTVRGIQGIRDTYDNSPDYRISGKGPGSTAGRAPLGFRLAENGAGQETKPKTGAALLENLTAHPGLTVIEAPGGSGKSLLFAELVSAWIKNGCAFRGAESLEEVPPGSAPSKNLTFNGLHHKNIAKGKEGVDAQKLVCEALGRSDVVLLDALDEADWRDEKGRDTSWYVGKNDDDGASFGTFLAKELLRAENAKKTVIIATRPGYISGTAAHKVTLAPFGEQEADSFVEGYFAGSPDAERIFKEWKWAKDAGGREFMSAALHPLTLALICEAVAGTAQPGQKKPSRFVEYANPTVLYETVARMRLNRWENLQHKTPEAIINPEKRTEAYMVALGQVAYFLSRFGRMEGRLGVNELKGYLPADCLEHLGTKSAAHGTPLLNPLQTILSQDADGKIKFAHRSFYEYFLLRHLRRCVDAGMDVPISIVLESCGHDERKFYAFCEGLPGNDPDALRKWALPGGDRKPEVTPETVAQRGLFAKTIGKLLRKKTTKAESPKKQAPEKDAMKRISLETIFEAWVRDHAERYIPTERTGHDFAVPTSVVKFIEAFAKTRPTAEAVFCFMWNRNIWEETVMRNCLKTYPETAAFTVRHYKQCAETATDPLTLRDESIIFDSMETVLSANPGAHLCREIYGIPNLSEATSEKLRVMALEASSELAKEILRKIRERPSGDRTKNRAHDLSDIETIGRKHRSLAQDAYRAIVELGGINRASSSLINRLAQYDVAVARAIYDARSTIEIETIELHSIVSSSVKTGAITAQEALEWLQSSPDAKASPDMDYYTRLLVAKTYKEIIATLPDSAAQAITVARLNALMDDEEMLNMIRFAVQVHGAKTDGLDKMVVLISSAKCLANYPRTLLAIGKIEPAGAILMAVENRAGITDICDLLGDLAEQGDEWLALETAKTLLKPSSSWIELTEPFGQFGLVADSETKRRLPKKVFRWGPLERRVAVDFLGTVLRKNVALAEEVLETMETIGIVDFDETKDINILLAKNLSSELVLERICPRVSSPVRLDLLSIIKAKSPEAALNAYEHARFPHEDLSEETLQKSMDLRFDKDSVAGLVTDHVNHALIRKGLGLHLEGVPNHLVATAAYSIKTALSLELMPKAMANSLREYLGIADHKDQGDRDISNPWA